MLLFENPDPGVPENVTYIPGVSTCLFDSVLYNSETASGLAVSVVGGGIHMQYPVFLDLPFFLVRNLAPPVLKVCTPPNQDIRSGVMGVFGDVDELIVTEVLEAFACGRNDIVRYFGRSARLIFNSTETSE